MHKLVSLISMGGYGFYVWTSYGLVILALVLNTLDIFKAKKCILARLKKMKGIL